jgi:hypothetical protein
MTDQFAGVKVWDVIELAGDNVMPAADYQRVEIRGS